MRSPAAEGLSDGFTSRKERDRQEGNKKNNNLDLLSPLQYGPFTSTTTHLGGHIKFFFRPANCARKKWSERAECFV